jgi:hypothetical protein
MHVTQNQPDSPATAEMTTPADTLRGTAHYIAVHGWTQGDYYSGDTTIAFPPACAIGAIAMVVYGRRHADPFDMTLGNRFEVIEAVDVFGDYLTRLDPVTDWDTDDMLVVEVPEWNDRDDRTAAEVIAALNAAADAYDKELDTVTALICGPLDLDRPF